MASQPVKLARDNEGHVIHAEMHAGDGVVWLQAAAIRRSAGCCRTLAVVQLLGVA